MEPTRKANRIAEVVAAIPIDCPHGQLQERLAGFFTELRRSLPREREVVERAVGALAERREAVRALLDAYAGLASERFGGRLEILQVLGALRREDAFEGLANIAWKALPPSPARVRCVQVTPRAREETIQSKAVQGIAYLRSERAFAEAERIMREHESVAVRVEAIDAWMWNKGDADDAAARLYSLLPPQYHPYVERPRFHRGMDAARFEERMLAWMRRWAPKGKLPANPRFLDAGPSHAAAKS